MYQCTRRCVFNGSRSVTRRTSKDGKDISMEELLDMLADAYEEKEALRNDYLT
jgi:hypothetical protein